MTAAWGDNLGGRTSNAGSREHTLSCTSAHCGCDHPETHFFPTPELKSTIKKSALCRAMMSIGPPYGVWALVECLCSTSMTINSLISVPSRFPRPVQGFLGTESEYVQAHWPIGHLTRVVVQRHVPACRCSCIYHEYQGFCAICADPID